MPHSRSRLALLASLWLLSSGCAAFAGAFVIADLLANPDDRRDIFEATLEEMDINPHYVTEFVDQALAHAPALEQLISETADIMENPALSAVLAVALADDPAALTQVVVSVLAEATGAESAESALSAAFEEQSGAVVAALAGTVEGATSVLDGLLDASIASPALGEPLAALLGGNAESVATLLSADTAALDQVATALLAVRELAPPVLPAPPAPDTGTPR
jgi:hypothetical protein